MGVSQKTPKGPNRKERNHRAEQEEENRESGEELLVGQEDGGVVGKEPEEAQEHEAIALLAVGEVGFAEGVDGPGAVDEGGTGGAKDEVDEGMGEDPAVVHVKDGGQNDAGVDDAGPQDVPEAQAWAFVFETIGQEGDEEDMGQEEQGQEE